MSRFIYSIRAIPRYIFEGLVFRFLGGVALARLKGVKVGKNCRIYIRQFGTEPFLISVGDDVTITSGVKIITHDGSTALVRDKQGRRHYFYAPVKIGNNVFVGVDTIILPGTKIGSNVVIGAGSVVTRDIPDNSVAVGNPAKVVRSFEAFESRVVRHYVNELDINGIYDYRRRVHKALSLTRE